MNPKLVLFEVYPKTLSIDGVESSLDLISNDINGIYSMSMAWELNNIKTYNTLLYAATRDLFNMDKYFVEPNPINGDTYISGGYVEKEIAYYSPTTLPKQTLDLNQKQLESFEEVINILKGRNIDVIFIFAPISKSLYSSYSDYSDFDKLMTEYPSYYNFNEILSLNDSLHFYDSDHLNQTGVEIFNKSLIKILKEK